MIPGGFVVLDFGSQLTQLITRRLRELGYYSELLPYNAKIDLIRSLQPSGIILSGGPSSVNDPDSPLRPVRELLEVAPVLGICYGMQLIAKDLGGVVQQASHREYGHNTIQWKHPLNEIPERQKVWMSHGDIVQVPPPGVDIVAFSESGHPAALRGDRLWAFQFHPEVTHTEHGLDLLKAFASQFCHAKKNWETPKIASHLIDEIRHKVDPDEQVICGLSGGVDSSVVAALLTKALDPAHVQCVFVDNGLLRQNEFQNVMKAYQDLGLNVLGVDASQDFLQALEGLEDPELKRKTIGRIFIDVFTRAVRDQGNYQWLAQGTLYPDVIESVSPRGNSVTIKSHHNVGGLPEKLHLKLLEPLRELFKDEVRAIGEQLGLPPEILGRHPFPGPGLAIRILGAVTQTDLEILRRCDEIFVSELKREGLYQQIWQAFCVLLPVKTVGVQGDARTYDRVVALRAVTSHDGMTADWYAFEPLFLRQVSNKITNLVKGVNRVVYDVTSKPPGTIEWE